MTSEKNYDDLLCPILHSEGNIVGFFDRIFEFLYRRTDYFKIKTNPSSDFGLKHGEAEDILRTIFCKYMEHAADQHRLEAGDCNEATSLDYIVEEVVSSSEPDSSIDVHVSAETAANNETTASLGTNAEDSNQQSKNDDTRVVWMDPDCYNGARYEDYTWSQTIKDLDVRIKVPSHITGKQVKVNIDQSSICAELLLDGQWQPLKKEALLWKINVEESTWTLVPGQHIHICLQKLKDCWWDSCFVGERKIDLKSLDLSMPYEDLDDEAQAKIQELMYNEYQKRLGKPTVQENKIQNILKDAWDKEGSPFKGQPFDPSLVNLQNADSL